MVGGGVAQHEMQIHGTDVGRVGDLDVVDLCARRAQPIQRAFEGTTDFVVQQVAEVRT